MKHIFKISLVFAISFLVTSIYAQSSTLEEQIRMRAAEKVKQLCDYIEFMANPENPMDIRIEFMANPENPMDIKDRYRSKAVKLFFANCEPYEEDGIRNEGVAMEVSSIYRSKPTRRLMKDYFMGLINMRYSKVIIQSTDIHDMDVSQLHQVDENMYVCTVAFVQVFVGYRDGKPVYSDRTKKRVKCYVLKEETVDGDEYIVKLGDTRVEETKKLKVSR